MSTSKNFDKLEKKLGIKFKDKNLLQQAFVHRSYLNEHPKCGLDHNERLEFLGDAVLELAITRYLYEKYPNPEGELTTWRASLVNSKMLSEIAARLGLNDYLLLSRGETKDIGRARQFILANTFEALVGATFLDHGFEKAEEFIKKNLIGELTVILKHQLYRDPKSRFQEEAQERSGTTPTYEVLGESGPDHNKQFIVGVFLGEKLIAKGEGPSKQVAQEKAAETAIKKKKWE